MKRITSTQSELIPVSQLQATGLQLLHVADPARYGFPAGCDIWECLWYSLQNELREFQNTDFGLYRQHTVAMPKVA